MANLTEYLLHRVQAELQFYNCNLFLELAANLFKVKLFNNLKLGFYALLSVR